MSSVVPFTVLVPVKPPRVGKSRLGDLPDERRVALAEAFALDTIRAARSAELAAEVMVVTDDAGFARTAGEAGCAVLPDGVSDDLNGTLVQAALECWRRWPSYGVAALCADLPALRPEDLDAALASVPGTGAAFAVDAPGTGTTMYAARAAADFDPRFGVGSAMAHTEAGAFAVAGELASLRQDVDQAGDLGRAMVLGVGTHTARAL